jgi:ATP-binding cassette subfamily C protein
MIETVRKCLQMLPAERRWWWLAVPVMALLTGMAEAFNALGAASAVLSEALVGAGIFAVLLAAAPGTTLIITVVLVVVVAVLLRWTRTLARRIGRESHELDRELLQTLQHALGAIKEIKALGREGFFYRAYAEKQRERLEIGFVGVTLEALPPVVIETVFVCGALLVIALLTVSGRAGVNGLPLLGLFAYAGFRVIPMANRLTWRLNELRTNETPVHALYEDYRLVSGQESVDDDAAPAPLDVRQTIAVERVSYTYPGAAAPALHDISLTIRRGETLGFVGPTGAGKSTLVDVVVGLLPPTVGQVTIDGVDLASCSRAWRRHIGYVPQSVFLLDDTLRRNVALGIPDSDIDDARVRKAIRLARLDEVAAALPGGIEAVLGERGVRLSGGERQRVGIARALYHDPAVLVLDEATSALDTATEADVIRALRTLQGEKTVLVIAHRFSTVRGCNRIALIVEGRLADCGTYDELLERNEDFHRLAAAAEPLWAHERRLA